MPRPAADEDVFRAIADPIRRRILERLTGGEQPVGALASEFDVSLPAVSQHLKVLRDAGLVTVRSEGRERLYALDPEPLREVADWAAHFERFWRGKLAALDRYLKRTTQ